MTTPDLSAIRERCNTVTINGERPPGVFGSVYDLLAHIDRLTAERDAMREVLEGWVDTECHCDEDATGKVRCVQCRTRDALGIDQNFNLSPPPSAPGPELAGWRAKCDIFETSNDKKWMVRRDTETCGVDWLDRATGQFIPCTRKEGSDWAEFPTRAAAVAALNAAAPPPGVEEPKPVEKGWCLRCDGGDPTCYICGKPAPTTANTRPAVVADGKGVPAAGFDAERAAEECRFRLDTLPSVNRMEVLKEHIATAHAAGAASAKPRRWPEGRPTGTYDRIMRWNQKYNGWDIVRQDEIEDGAWWLPQPAAPADAKEAAQ